jgi:hypothetical protein
MIKLFLFFSTNKEKESMFLYEKNAHVNALENFHLEEKVEMMEFIVYNFVFL